MSVLSRDEILAIERAPQIARDALGRPLASSGLVVSANVPRRDGEEGSVTLRGVGEMAWAVRPGVRLVDGRRFETGRRELVVGRGAQRQFQGLEPGNEVQLGNERWTVVGVFESGDATESEMWADAEVVGATYRRGSSRASLYARLAAPEAFNAFKATLAADPRLQVDADTTLGYFSSQSRTLTTVLRVIGIVVGSIMAIGAVFGALNTMFATVAARAREIATLRAIGFRGLPVVVAVMLETMLLALLGDRGCAIVRLPRPAGGGRGDARDDAAGAAGRPAGRDPVLAGVQRLHRLYPGRRCSQPELRVPRLAAAAVGRPEVGAGDRLRRRPVPGRARGHPSGHRRPARDVRARAVPLLPPLAGERRDGGARQARGAAGAATCRPPPRASPASGDGAVGWGYASSPASRSAAS